ncbi:MAG: PilN domain-containing protein, partial [Gammaproteobacteria bacterium]|nr:PilN domain-containing protein [Gammaproteobacteria bacterium]
TMLIQGQAMDHVAMSDFVTSLTRQPDIENVRIVSSRLNRGGQVKLVDFSLEIIVVGNIGRV